MNIYFNIDVRDFILIVVAILNSVLGLLILFKNRKDPINVFYGFTAFSTSLWAVGLAMFRLTGDLSTADFWARLYYIAAALIGFSFLLFSFYFPFQNLKVKKSYKLLFFFFSAAVIVISLWPKFLVQDIAWRDWGKEVKLSDFYIIYTTYFIMCMVGAFGSFISKLKGASRLQRIQINYVFAGTLIAAIWGVAFNLIFPLIGNYKFIWLGPYLTVIMVGLIAYAVIKHQLMNIRVIATEAFAVLIPLSLLIDIFFSKTKTETLLKIGLFIIVSFFSIFLIRSVLKEVRSKEALEKMTKSLHKANLELQKLDRAKSDFISIASHQLRTPLSIVKGLASMVIEGSFGEVGDKVKEQVTKIYDSNERLNKLVDSLLDLSHIEGGKLQFDFAKVDFTAMAQSVADELSLNAQKKGLEFSFKKPAEPFFVRADEQKLRQVVLNLVDNAIKYTPQGSVTMDLTKKDGYLLLAIKDTGMGLGKGEKEQLFQKFVRGANAPRLHTEGAGIGLYVAKKMLEEHKGEVWAESEGEGKGSTFFVKLPEWTEARQ